MNVVVIAGGIILAVSGNEGEETIWVQLLVLIALAAGVGVYSFVRKRANQFGQQEDFLDYPGRAAGLLSLEKKLINARIADIYPETAEQETEIQKEPTPQSGAAAIAGGSRLRSAASRGKDLASGMEMLEQDLLVRIVEQTEGTDQYDVMMRRLSFNELVRREQLGAADSRALKVYAVNRANLYGKDIQCQAMRELAERTGIRV